MINLIYPLILASNSPRRKEILLHAGFDFTIQTADVNENTNETEPKKIVAELSARKARTVFYEHKEAIVLGADTIVSIQGTVLGKPKDDKEAFSMLKSLSGQMHEVYTGVTICHPNGERTFYDKTNVYMYEHSDAWLKAYIQTGEPMDKAGAYGIQEIGCMLVSHMEGNYHNVVGLPIARVGQILSEEGLFAPIKDNN